MQEMMDAELQGRCLTLPPCHSEDVEDFRELYDEFMAQLRVDPPADSIMKIGEAIGKFLMDMEQTTILREAKDARARQEKREKG